MVCQILDLVGLLYLGKCSTTELHPSACFLSQAFAELPGLPLEFLSCCLNLLSYGIIGVYCDIWQNKSFNIDCG